tara:strand:+ start:1873 stop:2673 length:801 start_codon:yes stop_codon:yes gene_type:complete
MTNYNFGEKKEEYHSGQGKKLPVWQSPKYLQSKEKAIELIEDGKFGLTTGDFWILQNATKSGKMMYTGLIIAHNGCLKINDKLDKKMKFSPDSVSFVKDEGEKNKVMSYSNEEQGVYEFGEISPKNCMNDYPYAMVLKRLMDRVILKNSKVGFFGIYSDSESEDFKEKPEEKEVETKPAPVKKNTSGLKENTALTDGSAMKEMQDAENTKQFARIKDEVENAGSLAQLQGIWEDNVKQINSLRKYMGGLYDLLIGSKNIMKEKLGE